MVHATRYLQAMDFAKGQTLVGMSIVPQAVASQDPSDAIDDDDSSPAAQDTVSADAANESEAELAAPAVLLVTAQGLGKRVPVKSFKLQKRGGMGAIAIKCNPGDKLVALHVVSDQNVHVQHLACHAVLCLKKLPKFCLQDWAPDTRVVRVNGRYLVACTFKR